MNEIELKEAETRVMGKVSALSAALWFFVSNFDKMETKTILLHELESLAIDLRMGGFDDAAEDVKLLIVNRVNAI